MNNRHVLIAAATLFASSAVLILAPVAGATSTTPKVTVRVEGKAKTLLATTIVQTKQTSITRGGAPAGVCAGSSVQGALAVATHGNWQGSYSTSYKDYFVTGILGDTESGKTAYWELFVNNIPAAKGACQVALSSGQQVLFAVVPATGAPEHPLGATAPATAVPGRPFTAKVVYYNAKGKAVPLAGATAELGGHSVTTNAAGVTGPLVASGNGTQTLTVSKSGYIRTEATVQVKAS